MLLLLYYIQRVGVICPHVNTRYTHLRAAKSKAYRETPPKRYVPCTLLPANGVFQALFIHRYWRNPYLGYYLFHEPVSCARRENCPRIYPWRLYFITSKIIVIILPKLIDIGVHLVVPIIHALTPTELPPLGIQSNEQRRIIGDL